MLKKGGKISNEEVVHTLLRRRFRHAFSGGVAFMGNIAIAVAVTVGAAIQLDERIFELIGLILIILGRYHNDLCSFQVMRSEKES